MKSEFSKIEAIFLDRDGTINEEPSLGKLIYKKEDFFLIENAARAIKIFNDLQIPVIIISNQPAVARNLCTEEDVDELHKYMIDLLADSGAKLDFILYCPHHPETHHPEGNAKYRIVCECRKPGIKMLKDASLKLNFNLKNAVIIGDKTVDVMTGKNADCKTILLLTGWGGEDKKHDVKPDFICKNLYDAALLIKNSEK